MFNGTAEQLAEQERKNRTVADRIAKLLAELESGGPVWIQAGAVGFSGGEIRRDPAGWIVR